MRKQSPKERKQVRYTLFVLLMKQLPCLMWQDLSELWMSWSQYRRSAPAVWLKQKSAPRCLLPWVQGLRVTWRSECSCSLPLPCPLHVPGVLHPPVGMWSTREKRNAPVLGIFLRVFSCSHVQRPRIVSHWVQSRTHFQKAASVWCLAVRSKVLYGNRMALPWLGKAPAASFCCLARAFVYTSVNTPCGWRA